MDRLVRSPFAPVEPPTVARVEVWLLKRKTLLQRIRLPGIFTCMEGARRRLMPAASQSQEERPRLGQLVTSLSRLEAQVHLMVLQDVCMSEEDQPHRSCDGRQQAVLRLLKEELESMEPEVAAPSCEEA